MGKICDFGMAHITFSGGAPPVVPATQYVCTRWYRAPEVICSWTEYDASIDLWSAGCIFAEMIGRAPLFPGMSTQHQLQLYAQVLGTEMEAFAKMPNEKCKHFLGSLPHCPVRKFSEIIDDGSPLALEMLEKMICFDPAKRSTVEEALALKFLADLHNPEDEPKGTKLDPKLFEFDSAEQDALPGVLREEFAKEVLVYRPKFFEQLEK